MLFFMVVVVKERKPNRFWEEVKERKVSDQIKERLDIKIGHRGFTGNSRKTRRSTSINALEEEGNYEVCTS